MSIKDAAQAVIKKTIQIAPDAWMPGGSPDPLIRQKHGLIGSSVSRLDGPQKVGGTAQFAAEFPLAGMVYAALKYSTVARGTIREMDTSAAEGAPGVVLVMTHLNAPRMKPAPAFMSSAKAAGGDDLPIMQNEQIHWNGQPVAVVLAESQEQADHAKSLIRVEYDAEPALTVFEEAKGNAEPGVFQGEPLLLEIGDAEAALAAAPHKVDIVYRTPRHNHNPIELHAATVTWKGDDLILHDASQCVTHTAWSLAEVFGMKEEQVHVTSPYVGGGVRKQDIVAAPDPCCCCVKAGRQTGPADAVARGGLPHRGWTDTYRATGRDWLPGRRPIRRTHSDRGGRNG